MKKNDLNFEWNEGRSAGVFLHISALPSEYGIGNIGEAVIPFLEFLKSSGMSWWQICPLGPTGYGDSPYQSFSSFAGNPYFIDLGELEKAGLLEKSDLAHLSSLPKNQCDYGAIYNLIPDLLRKASKKWRESRMKDVFKNFKFSFKNFCKKNSEWLDTFALFSALKRYNNGKPWYEWEPSLRDFKKAPKTDVAKNCEDEIFYIKFSQWVFYNQYEKFKTLAKEYGIKIFGDIPIFVAHDSADVWANPSIFELNKDGTAKNVAGVGPDYFCAEGQLWGNPLYDWKNKKAEVYEFWRKRILSASNMYDAIRFDHFRGFADYWSIPAKTNDARKGSWKIGAGADFFAFLKKHFPKARFVAEDLGLLSKRACDLRDSLKIPAMAVMQFAFGDNASNPYFPHNVKRNCIYYTGTHDNDTAVGWYNSAEEKARDQLRRYFRSAGDSVNWDMIHSVMLSVANLAIIPMQDILGFGSDCRFNTPGKPDGNWQWRMTSENLATALEHNAPYLKSLSILGGRYREVEVKKLGLKK